jgi:glycosyltransferase involved in cell wall biosynthesis
MIFVTDKGRLANNIFQYGQLYAWGREHGRKTMSMRFAHKYPEFLISHTRHHNSFLYVIAKLAAKLHLIPTVEFHVLNEYHQQEETMLNNKHVLATGWCVRYPDLFEKYKDEIIHLFEFMPQVRQNMARALSLSSPGTIKLGVHIRRGDYRTWCGGRYFFDDDQYIAVIKQFVQLQTGKQVDVYVCSNDPQLVQDQYIQQLHGTNVYFPKGTAAEDLCLLSECDYIIGPPSTFTLVASMYRDAHLYWMADTHHLLSLDSFHTFNYQARHFDDYYIDDYVFEHRKTTTQPLVSLIISTYNTETYLGECIESVLAQTYQHWELIIVDDGSTDKTPAICDKFAATDERIHVIHKQNTGQSDSRNIAIKIAKGEFIGIIDSDDWIAPNYCETLLKAIAQTNKDCATCGYLNEFSDETVHAPVSQHLRVLNRSEAIAMIYDRQLSGYIHGRLYHRSLLVEPIPQLKRYEDFAVIYKWLSHGNGMTLCPQFLYHYRQRRSSIMNSSNDYMFGYTPLLEECYHYLHEHNLLPENQNKRLLVRNCIRIAKAIARETDDSETIEKLESIREIISRVQPVSRQLVGMKCYWRMRLFLISANIFKRVVRMSHPYRNNNSKISNAYYQ